jgi:transposase
LERWIRRRGKNYLPAKQGKSSSSKIDDQQLRLFVRQHPDAYLREIAEKFGTTLQSRFYACKRLKISLKKDPLLGGER